MYLAILILCITLHTADGYPQGPPLTACQSMMPNHSASPQTRDPPYTINVNTTSYTSVQRHSG